jgi:hypothetical protein
MRYLPFQTLAKAKAPLWVCNCARRIADGTAEQRHRDIVALYLMHYRG